MIFLGYQFEKKFKLKKTLESRSEPMWFVESDLFFLHSFVDICARFVDICARIKKRTNFVCLIVQPANVQKTLEFEISARIWN